MKTLGLKNIITKEKKSSLDRLNIIMERTEERLSSHEDRTIGITQSKQKRKKKANGKK